MAGGRGAHQVQGPRPVPQSQQQVADGRLGAVGEGAARDHHHRARPIRVGLRRDGSGGGG
eukprot:CAMPEP_0196796874 /NCGR_PEP_ID=MMETSP1104-20130614/38208_1 /TAXON_ID=33652 /ORGANISM="Cafeteria sp., Strain Caron Lab Isolate" /LENGTH=59 /DNA_ID=CAMNT_0042167273 /DNA_START=135 /DNA_END=310 /DNA_ORIENTATION=-